jgi:hypothetical protein
MGDSLQCEVSVAPSQVDNGSVDPDGGTVTLLLEPAGPYPEGVTAVVLTVTDVCGDSDTCQAIITVTCPQGPVLEVFPEDLVLSPVATADTTCGKVTIVNTGDLPLDLTSISGCDSGDFFVDTSGTSFGLAPGDTTMLDVCYVANSPEPASCDLTISSNAGAGAVSRRRVRAHRRMAESIQDQHRNPFRAAARVPGEARHLRCRRSAGARASARRPVSCR